MRVESCLFHLQPSLGVFPQRRKDDIAGSDKVAVTCSRTNSIPPPCMPYEALTMPPARLCSRMDGQQFSSPSIEVHLCMDHNGRLQLQANGKPTAFLFDSQALAEIHRWNFKRTRNAIICKGPQSIKHLG